MKAKKRTRAGRSDLEATSTIFAMMSAAIGFDCVTPFAEMAKKPETKKLIYDSAKKALPKKKKKK